MRQCQFTEESILEIGVWAYIGPTPLFLFD